MGLVLPQEATRELEITQVTEEECQFDLEIARAVGCVILHSKDSDLLSYQRIAVYPETGGLTLWWAGLVTQENSLPRGVARVDGLAYAGIKRRPDSRLPILRRYQHQYAPVENIRSGDKVALRDNAEQEYSSHVIRKIERPES